MLGPLIFSMCGWTSTRSCVARYRSSSVTWRFDLVPRAEILAVGLGGHVHVTCIANTARHWPGNHGPPDQIRRHDLQPASQGSPIEVRGRYLLQTVLRFHLGFVPDWDMDPFSIVTSTQAVGRRFSFYITVQVASVLAPGIVVIVGIFFLIGLLRGQVSSEATQAIAKDFSGANALLASFILLAAGYVGGYVLRELAFILLAQVERIPHFRDELRMAAHDDVVNHVPEDIIDQFLEVHPLLSGAYRIAAEITEASEPERIHEEEASVAEATQAQVVPAPAVKNSETEFLRSASSRRRRRAGGGHMDDMEYINFVYAKLWIRNYAPGFSIDSIEAEINILVSSLFPILLAGAVIIASGHAVWWSVVTGLGFVVLVWSILLKSALRLRRSEKKEAVRNLLLDFSMRQAAAKYPYSPMSISHEDQAE